MSRHLIVFRGVDNFIDIAVQDQEQQWLAINDYSFRFKVRDRSANIIIDKEIIFVEGYNYKLGIDLLATDLADLDLGSYVWGVTVIDEDDRTRPLFLELNGEVDGVLQLVDSPIS